MPTKIHSTAIVSDDAVIGENVSIGPYCIVDDKVTLGDDVTLVSHVSLTGKTTIGARSKLYPFVSMGHPPQDFKHKGGDVWITIGEDCTFRENVNIHPGTDTGKPETRIGNNCYFMVGTHLAHEGQMGDHVVISNGAQIGGNVTIGDYVVLGGLCAIHQHTRIGDYAFIGGMATVTRDVIPYGFVLGNQAHLAGLNIIGLRRRGFTKDEVRELRSAYRLMFAAEGTFNERLDDVQRLYAKHELVQEIIAFIRNQKDRSICLPPIGG